MQITRVDITKVHNTGSRKAEASIMLDKSFCVKGISILEGQKGLFIVFPSTGKTMTVNGKKHYEDLVHPTNNNLRKSIEDAVLDAYWDYIEKKA